MVDRAEKQGKRILDTGRLKEDLEDKGQTVVGKAYEEGKDRGRTKEVDMGQEGSTKTGKKTRTEPVNMQSISIAGAGGQTPKNPIETN